MVIATDISSAQFEQRVQRSSYDLLINSLNHYFTFFKFTLSGDLYGSISS